MRKLATKLIVLLTVFGVSPCAADDLMHENPDRKAILNAAHQYIDSDALLNQKFIVKHLVKDGDWAYLCALVEDNGYKDVSGVLHRESHGIENTDGQPDVHQIILYRKNGNWSAVAEGGGLASTARDVDCRSNDGKIIQNSHDINEYYKFLKTTNP